MRTLKLYKGVDGMNKYLVRYYIRNGHGALMSPCGTSHQMIVHLKTLKGTINRARRYAPNDAVRIAVYEFHSMKLLEDIEL